MPCSVHGRNIGKKQTNHGQRARLLAARMVWLVVMQAWRARGNRQTGRHAGPRRGGAMVALFRRKDDIAEVGPDDWQALDQKIELAFQHNPELGEILMKMAKVAVGRRGNAGLADDVGPSMVVLDEAAALAAPGHDVLLEVQIGLVDLVILAAAGIAGLIVSEARYRS